MTLKSKVVMDEVTLLQKDLTLLDDGRGDHL